MLWSVAVKEVSQCGYIVSKAYENDANNPLDSIFLMYCRWKIIIRYTVVHAGPAGMQT